MTWNSRPKMTQKSLKKSIFFNSFYIQLTFLTSNLSKISTNATEVSSKNSTLFSTSKFLLRFQSSHFTLKFLKGVKIFTLCHEKLFTLCKSNWEQLTNNITIRGKILETFKWETLWKKAATFHSSHHCITWKRLKLHWKWQKE